MRDLPTRRWPLHPPPGPGEALSSWLSRLAELYGMSVVQLLENNLGSASALARRAFDDDLDWDPPAELLDALAERTGTPRGDLRLMTIAGWVPWLADTLDPDDGSKTLHTYARQDSVLLWQGETGINVVDRWRPWIPLRRDRRTTRRVCPVCTTDPLRGTLLTATLPLMLSCPEHGCRLENDSEVDLAAVLGRPLPHRAAPGPVLALDRLTHEGLATGAVTLPRRPVHVGVWLRLLRTLLDEVSVSTSRVGQQSAAALDLTWNTMGLRPRAGLNVWRPYEMLDPERQEAMLEAAACALNLIQTGKIFARGSLAPLLTLQPHHPVYDGDRRPRAPDDARTVFHEVQSRAWTETQQALEEWFEAARSDPAAARQIFDILTYACGSHEAVERERVYMMNLGIPGSFLPAKVHDDHFGRRYGRRGIVR